MSRLGAVLLCLLGFAIVTWTRVGSSAIPDQLIPGRPYDVPLKEGRATVDLPLQANAPVRLIISNLGSVSRTAILQARVEPVRGFSWQHQPIPWQKKTLPTGVKISPAKTTGLTVPKTKTSSSPPASTRDFWLHVTEAPLENAQGYQRVQGRLVCANQTVEVYADPSLDSPSSGPTSIEPLAHDIAERLSRDVLPLITRQIGPITDADQNGRLTVLLTPWLGRLRGGTTQVRGFVRSSDLRMDLPAPFSNHADLLYLNSELPVGDALQSLLLHEVAHTALASRPNVSLPRRARSPEWEDWLNEGLAHLTERQGSHDWSNLDYRAASYWQNPAAAPLVVRDYYRTGRWRNHGCRGATFLFLDWCQQRAHAAGVTHFIPALMATGKTDVEAIEHVLQAPFAELYRDWTIALATEATAGQEPTKVGRFLDSGPRYQHWNLTDESTQAFSIVGTATQFVELRASQTGRYRLVLAGDALDEWQVTLLRPERPAPAIALQAQWSRGQPSEQIGLQVTSQQPPPAGWHLENISCEAIQEPRIRVQNWTAANLQIANDATFSTQLPLRAADFERLPTVIKARFQNTAGDITWSWVDIPPYLAAEQLAAADRDQRP